jgi:Ca2+-binding RTX toxin-like protein
MLAERTLPAITLSGGVLQVIGTNGSDVINVTTSGDQIRVQINSTGETQSFSASAVTSLDIRCGNGDDRVFITGGISADAVVRGGGGDDVAVGGSGDDNFAGGSGRDTLRGRGGDDSLNGNDGDDICDGGTGNDRCHGGRGNDDLRGGDGDDSLNGSSGHDLCRRGRGNDDVSSGLDLDTELIAVFTTGNGDAEFKFGPDDGGWEREFEVEIEDQPPATSLTVVVDGVTVGTFTTNSFGAGQLKYELDFDSNADGTPEFPPGFPEVQVGSTITVLRGTTVVAQGTFVLNPGG